MWAISIPRPTQEMPVYMVIGRCYRGNRILPTSIILDHRPHLDTTGLGRTSVLCRVATSYVLLGGTTGQICGFVVQSTFARVKIGNVSTGHITKLAKKEGRINTHGCNGFRGGDSGGPAYYNNGSGKMIYTGIVTGHSRAKRGTQYRCTYYVTQLSGVRAWKGSVKW